MNDPTAYPLAWPMGWPRSDSVKRAKFGVRTWNQSNTFKKLVDVTIAEGVKRVLYSLEQFGVVRDDIVISTMLRLRNDGLPMSNQREPEDAGVAVYWKLDGEGQCMAIDIYTRIADNLAAVAATIDAMRAIERHGGAQVLKRAFLGMKALPASTTPVMNTEQAARKLAELAGFVPEQIVVTISTMREYKRAALNKVHPDRWGGDQERFLLAKECIRVLEAHLGEKL